MSGGAERRRHARVPLIADIHYQSNSPVLTARVSDFSNGGVFIDTVNALDPGATLKFRLLLPAELSAAPVVGEGVVAWRQPMMGMGLRFTRMNRADWERIVACVNRIVGQPG